jgi:hypothetical protein
MSLRKSERQHGDQDRANPTGCAPRCSRPRVQADPPPHPQIHFLAWMLGPPPDKPQQFFKPNGLVRHQGRTSVELQNGLIVATTYQLPLQITPNRTAN